MSKHQKALRRERRKTDATRRRRSRLLRSTNHGPRITCAGALAAAAAIAAGTSAYAEQVRFDNPPHGEPGHFHWVPNVGQGDRQLDVTLPADSQPAAGFSSVSQLNNGGDSIQMTTLYPAGARFIIGGYAGAFVQSVDAGVEINGAMETWGSSGFINYPGFGSDIPKGLETYLPVRFSGGVPPQNYAWIGVVRTGTVLEAFAWGYETEPGVPIPAGAGGGGGCEANEDCDDGDFCTEDLCDLAEGTCSNDEIVCDDGDACTIDDCDPATGCTAEAIVCEEGQKCEEGKCVCDTNCPADFDHDGDVDAADLAFLLGSWGKCD